MSVAGQFYLISVVVFRKKNNNQSFYLFNLLVSGCGLWSSQAVGVQQCRGKATVIVCISFLLVFMHLFYVMCMSCISFVHGSLKSYIHVYLCVLSRVIHIL